MSFFLQSPWSVNAFSLISLALSKLLVPPLFLNIWLYFSCSFSLGWGCSYINLPNTVIFVPDLFLAVHWTKASLFLLRACEVPACTATLCLSCSPASVPRRSASLLLPTPLHPHLYSFVSFLTGLQCLSNASFFKASRSCYYLPGEDELCGCGI